MNRRFPAIPIVCAFLIGLVVVGGGPRSARGEPGDEHWESLSAPAGLDGRALILMRYGNDLIAGGEFTAAGTVVLNHVGAWDGTRWRPLGEGFDFSVRSLGIYQGDLIAGGDFTASGDRPMAHVARWNGSTWEPLGEGLGAAPNCFAEWRGDLVAGGPFRCGSGNADCLRTWNSKPDFPFTARWDGTRWTPMGGKRPSIALSSPPRDLIVYRDVLYAAGSFECWNCSGGEINTTRSLLVRWNGQDWIPAGPRVDRVGARRRAGATCLAIWDSLMVIGGDFTLLDSTAVNRVISFDGTSWRPMGAGVAHGLLDLAVSNGQLYGVGWVWRDGVVEWDGASWISAADGPMLMRSLADVNGTLYVCGGTDPPVMKLDGNALRVVGASTSTQYFPDMVRSLAAYRGTVIYSPFRTWFPVIRAPSQPMSHTAPTHANHMALPAWNPLWSQPMVVYRDKLMGCWATWDGVVAKSIARPLALPDPRVLAVVQDRVIAAGAFWGIPESGEVLSAWDGHAWTSFAPGIRPSSVEDDYPDLWMTQIDALAGYGDDIIAGGLFDFDAPAGGRNIAAWDGTAWRPLGDGVDDMVTSLVLYHGDLIAGGFFELAGGTAALHVARWDGTSWHPLGAGTDGPVYTLAVFNDRLVAGGWFTHAGDRVTGSLAAWDGQGWIPLGSGTNGEVMALAVNGDQLYAGGEFSKAGGKISYHLARWTEGPRQAAFSSLAALRTGEGVVVEARPSYLPYDHQGFLVYRRDAEGNRVPLTPQQASDAQDSFVGSPAPLGPAKYWIASVASTGAETVSDSVEVPSDPSLHFAVLPARPNPFRASTRLDFTTALDGRSRVAVFDVRGRRVADLLDAVLPIGEHSVTWDGRDATGEPVAAGAYFIRLRTPEGERVQRIVRAAP